MDLSIAESTYKNTTEAETILAHSNQTKEREDLFLSFEKVPTEIRLMIWKLALPTARFVKVDYSQQRANHGRPRAPNFLPEVGFSRAGFLTRTPPPSILAVCRESRGVALKTYSTLLAATPFNARIFIDIAIDTVFFTHGMRYNMIFTKAFNQLVKINKSQRICVRHCLTPSRLIRDKIHVEWLGILTCRRNPELKSFTIALDTERVINDSGSGKWRLEDLPQSAEMEPWRLVRQTIWETIEREANAADETASRRAAAFDIMIIRRTQEETQVQ